MCVQPFLVMQSPPSSSVDFQKHHVRIGISLGEGTDGVTRCNGFFDGYAGLVCLGIMNLAG